MMEKELYWYWFLNIPGIGRMTQKKILKKWKNPEYIYQASALELSPYLKKEAQLNMFYASKNPDTILYSYEKLLKNHINFIYYGCEEYPERLYYIPDPPLGLYLKGNLPVENRISIAIIGARNCTRYGMEMARYFGKALAQNGVNVISGLARGIDGYSHEGALLGNGYTLGVIGGGIDQIYPKENYKLYMQMSQKGGILSESNIGVSPCARLFPERNRIIAGLSDGILVVEAMEKSGTYITVDQGLEQGKDIFAIPGRILDKNSAGCNHIIKLGAHMVTDVQDILDAYGIHNISSDKLNDFHSMEGKDRKMLLAPVEKMVYSCLQIEPKYLDDIILEVKLAPQEVCKVLNKLVISDMITETSKNYYALKIV